MKQLLIVRDTQSIPTWAVKFSDANYNALLVADTLDTIAVPAGARLALVSASDFVYVASATFTLPASGAGFAASAGHLGKEVIDLETNDSTPVTTLYVRARQACDVSISFYGV